MLKSIGSLERACLKRNQCTYSTNHTAISFNIRRWPPYRARTRRPAALSRVLGTSGGFKPPAGTSHPASKCFNPAHKGKTLQRGLRISRALFRNLSPHIPISKKLMNYKNYLSVEELYVKQGFLALIVICYIFILATGIL